MKSSADFYTGLHEKEKGYSAAIYNFAPLLRSRALKNWAQARSGQSVRMLDVGCGKGLFLRDMISAFKRNWKVAATRVVGMDIVHSPGNVFSELGEGFEFMQHDVDGNPLPFADGSFDFVSCNHVLEHVFETEKLVREFRRVIDPKGFCVISVPNLAAWINRIALLWAGQPLGTEVGTESITYGFRPKFLHPKLAKFYPSGHVRDFTPHALRDLTEACGFQNVGWWSQGFDLAARFSKWGGRNLSILLQPAPAK